MDYLPLCRITSVLWARCWGVPPDVLSLERIISPTGQTVCMAESSWRIPRRSHAGKCMRTSESWDRFSCNHQIHTRNTRLSLDPSRNQGRIPCPSSLKSSCNTYNHGHLSTTHGYDLVDSTLLSTRMASCLSSNSYHLSTSCWYWTWQCDLYRCFWLRKSTIDCT